jgi:hypothetical protein
MKEDLMAREQLADLLLAVDHDLGMDDVVGACGDALEILVRGRPDFLQADEIGVAMRVEESEQLFRPGAAAPDVEADQLH